MWESQEKRRHQAGRKIICGTDPMGFNPISSTRLKDKMACACMYTHMDGAALRGEERLMSWLWNTESFQQNPSTGFRPLFFSMCFQRLLALHPQQQGICFNLLVKQSLISQPRDQGMFVMSLGRAAGAESCCCQRKRFDDSANEVLYWVWQQTTGNYFMEQRGCSCCLYRLPSHGHSYLDWWTGNISFLRSLLSSVDGWLLPLFASDDWSKVLTSPICSQLPEEQHPEFGASVWDQLL